MPALYTEDELAILRRPHVAKVWFGDFDLPAGRRRMHSGAGRLNIGGYEWRGITDPIGNQLVGIQEIIDPRFGQASAVTIIIAGINLEFFQSVRADGLALEGKSADIYWAAYDQETGQNVIGLKKLIKGKMTSPTVRWERGIGRFITLSVEGPFHSMNFAFGGMWSPSGQRQRYADDSGGDLIGVKVTEVYN